MVNHTYECSHCGNTWDAIVEWDQRYQKCECGKKAERSWALKQSRRFREPVVLHRYNDGSYGVPGRADGPTPAGAERIECWNMSDYERNIKKMNDSERSVAQRRHDIGEANRAEQLDKVREEVKYRLANASSQWEADMLRITLERGDKTYVPLKFTEFRNEALEYDSRRD
jgi:hypothetical protein